MGIVDQAFASGGVRHAHAGQLAQQRRGIPLHQRVKFHVPLRSRHRTVIDAGIIIHRQGHRALHHVKQLIAHPGAQHTDIGLLRPFFLFKGGAELLFVKGCALVLPVGFRQAQKLAFRPLPGAAVAAVEHVQHKEKVQLPALQQHVVSAADGVAAVHQHQFLHLALHAGLQQRLAETADVGVADLVAQIEIIRHMVQNGTLAAKGAQQFHRGVFTDIMGHAHACSPSSISIKASTRVAIWPSPPWLRSQPSPSRIRQG